MIRMKDKHPLLPGLAAATLLTSMPLMAESGPEYEPGMRLEFLEARLDAGRDRAALWQNGWSAVYAAVALGQGAYALTRDSTDEQVVNGVGALRAATAFTLLQLRPHPGRQGAAPVRAMTGADDAARLDLAEALLTRSARRAEERFSPRRHLINIGMNLGFGAMICAFGDCSDAPLSILLGIAGGEAALWSLPTRPARDLRDYRRRFGQDSGRVSWQVLPTPGGLAIRGRF
jgi:hypothetical protein